MFSTKDIRNNLKRHTIISTKATILAQLIKITLQVLSIVILARLLEASDFGLVAMVTVFTGLAKAFLDGGLSMATIQREEISHAEVSNLFWVNVVIGFIIAFLVILSAEVIAWIYDEPRLTEIMFGLSLMFAVCGLSVQHIALLKRQMRFKLIAIIDVISMAAGVISGILLAWNNYSYWALVSILVVTSIVHTVLAWVFTGWRPATFNVDISIKPLMSFGMYLTGANFLGYLVANITPFTVGYVGGVQLLGFYNRSYTISSLPTNILLPPINNVMQSTLSRISEEPYHLKRTILSLVKKIAIVTTFITTCMFIMADWLILIVLGEGWEEAIPIFKILSLFLIVTPITTFTAVALISTGKAKALMRWRVITLVILALALTIGSYWGAMGAILAHGLSAFFLRMPLFLFYSSNYLPVNFLSYIKALLPILLIAALSVLLLLGLKQLFVGFSPFFAVPLFFLLGGMIFLGLSFSIKSVRREILDMLDLTKSMLSRNF
jgi:PST family polysaccharide transporter